MKRRGLAGSLIITLLLAGCSDLGGGAVEGMAITDPETTLFNVAERRAFLANHDCNPYEPDSLAGFTPRPVTGFGGWSGFESHSIEYGQAINGHAMRWMNGNGDHYARDAISSLAWFAREDAFRPAGDHENSSAYAIGQTTLFLLTAWQILKTYPDLSPEDRTEIEDWIVRLINRAIRENQSPPNNHTTSQGMMLALGSIVLNRPDWFQRGLRLGFTQQIDQVRPDGSFPQESRRGQWAVIYHSRNIAHLLVVAEIAWNQGIDLYSYAPNGQSIHEVIRFMLAARENNALIDDEAQENHAVPDDYATFRFNAQRDPFEGHDTSWVAIYAHRFPDSDITQTLRALKPVSSNQGIRYSAVGGNVTCMIGF